MPFVTRFTVLLALVCAITVAACGTSDEDELRGIVRELRSALGARDGQRACGLLSDHAKVQLKGDCARKVLSFDPGRPKFDGALTVQAERAAQAIQSGGRTRGIAFRKIDGDWRIEELPLPTSLG